MATSTSAKNSSDNGKPQPSNGSSARRKPAARSKSESGKTRNTQTRRRTQSSHGPSWLATVMSVVGVGVAVGAGLYASRHQWLPKAQEWRDEFSAAYADDETDYENFDQTRHAGAESMRDHPGDGWEDIDDMSDASFPASDPPSFNPGTA